MVGFCLSYYISAMDDYRHGAEIRLDKPTKDLTSISNEVSKIDLNI